MGVKTSPQEFFKKCKEVHGDKYDYSESVFTKAKAKFTFYCNKHGYKTQIVQQHTTKKQGCKECADERIRSSTEEFISKSKVIHGEMYNYDLVDYKNNSTKVKIYCDIHKKVFEQTPNDHLDNCGCSECGKVKQVITFKKNHSKKVNKTSKHGGYSRSEFINICTRNSTNATLYLVELFNENERFYKIGITSQTINKRFAGKSDYTLNYKFVLTLQDAGLIYNLEKECKRNLKDFSHKPSKKFKGYTECFNYTEEIGCYFYLLMGAVYNYYNLDFPNLNLTEKNIN